MGGLVQGTYAKVESIESAHVPQNFPGVALLWEDAISDRLGDPERFGSCDAKPVKGCREGGRGDVRRWRVPHAPLRANSGRASQIRHGFAMVHDG